MPRPTRLPATIPLTSLLTSCRVHREGFPMRESTQWEGETPNCAVICYPTKPYNGVATHSKMGAARRFGGDFSDIGSLASTTSRTPEKHSPRLDASVSGSLTVA